MPSEKAAPEVTFWYQLHSYNNEITPVIFVKETAEFITYQVQGWNSKPDTRRSRKYGEFFPTFEEARSFAIARAEKKLQYCNDERSRLISLIKELKERKSSAE